MWCGRTSAWGSGVSPSSSLTGPTAICFSASVFLRQRNMNRGEHECGIGATLPRGHALHTFIVDMIVENFRSR